MCQQLKKYIKLSLPVSRQDSKSRRYHNTAGANRQSDDEVSFRRLHQNASTPQRTTKKYSKGPCNQSNLKFLQLEQLQPV